MTATRPSDRNALIEQARDLRARGLIYREIAARLGISVPYASELVRDPEGWRERRRASAPAARSDAEIGLAQMARLVTEHVGFHVDRARVQAAARDGKVPSRRGPGGRRLFIAAEVLAAIEAGHWRPHRTGGSEERLCGNPRCTNGAGGMRQRRRVPRSQLERLRDEVSPWTCSRDCAAAVQRGRPRGRGRVPRACGCEGCARFVLVSPRELETNTGPKRCDPCKSAGRPTAAQAMSGRASIVTASLAIDTAARDERARLLGARNRRSPDRMESLIEGRMRAHGAPFTDEMRRRVRGAALSRGQKESTRSRMTRELEDRVRELWSEGLTAEQVAERLQTEGWGRVNARHIWKLRERLDLPRRKPGPRPKSS